MYLPSATAALLPRIAVLDRATPVTHLLPPVYARLAPRSAWFV
jgi:hypothetical protein